MRSMKDSGIPWAGIIPINWTTSRIKYLPDDEPNSFIDGDWIESPFITDVGIRYLTTGNVGDGIFKRQGNGFISEKTLSLLGCKYAYPGDLVFSRLNEPYGRSCILPNDEERYVLAVDVVILRTNEDKRFLCYVSQCPGYHDSVMDSARGTTMKRISRTNLGNIVIPLPSLTEQRRIADFLDKKCAEIDSLTTDVQKEIETLQEYRRSLITEAVTKGLDPGAEMKDSGIEWATSIPSNWQTRRIKTLFRLREERNNLPLEKVNLISLYTDLGVVQHSDLEKTTGNKAFTADGYKIVRENDIVVNIILCWMGAIGRSSFSGVTSPAYDVYVPSNQVESRFYHYYFRTKGFNGDCYKRGKGIMAMRWRTYSDEFRDIRVVFPPLQEQQRIADFLDDKCAEIDSIIETKQKQLDILAEYRKSLIYEYVTGKKEVV